MHRHKNSNPIPNASGAYLKEARQQKGLTREEASKALGCSPGTLARYERNGIKNTIPALRLYSLCKLYDVSADKLLDLAGIK